MLTDPTADKTIIEYLSDLTAGKPLRNVLKNVFERFGTKRRANQNTLNIEDEKDHCHSDMLDYLHRMHGWMEANKRTKKSLPFEDK